MKWMQCIECMCAGLGVHAHTYLPLCMVLLQIVHQSSYLCSCGPEGVDV